MRKFLGGILILASLCGSSWADTPIPTSLAQTDPRLQLCISLGQKVLSGDVTGAEAIVHADPSLARNTFTWLESLLKGPLSPTDRKNTLGVMNFLAYAFEHDLHSDDLHTRLIALKLVDPLWFPAQVAAAPFCQLEAKSGLLGRPEYRLADSLLRLGDVAGARQLLQPFESEPVVRLLLAAGLQEAGQPSLALTQGQALLPALSGDAEAELYARTALLQSALQTYNRPVALEQISKALPLARRLSSRSARLSLFVLETASFAYELESSANMPLETYLQRHDKVWQILREAGSGRVAPNQLSWAFEAAQTWLRLDGYECLVVGEKRAGPVERACFEEGKLLAELWVSAPTLDNLEAYFGNLEEGATLLEAFRLGSKFTQAHQVHDYFQPFVTDSGGGLALISGPALKEAAQRGLAPRIPRLWHAQARVLRERARLAMAEGAAPQGGSWLEESRQLFEKGGYRSETCEGMVAQAEWLLKTRPGGWKEKGLSLLEEAYQSSLALGYGPGMFGARFQQGKLCAAAGDNPRAIAALQECVDSVEGYVALMGAGTEASSRFRGWFREVYETLTRLQLESGNKESAFATADRLQQLETLPPAPPVPPRLRGQLEQSRGQALGASESVAAGQGSPQLVADGKQKFFETLTSIRNSDPEYARLLAVRPVNFADIQRSLPATVALLQVLPSKDQLYLFVVTSTNFQIHTVPVGSQKIGEWVRAFRNQTRKVVDNSAPALELHRVLIDPIEAELKGKQTIAFIPTDSLNYLPLGALARKSGGKLEYLVERFQIVNLVKASDLFQHQAPPAASGGSPTILAFGNPDGTLVKAEEEVREIEKIFPGSKTYLRKEATFSHIAELGETEYLHFATHGVLNSSDPNSSFLVLSDQRLKLPAIYGLPLHKTRMVSLSACETALGEGTAGSEVSSLAQAFSIAGAPSVVASLWSVEDDSTRALMIEFYTRLKQGQGRAQALQGAQLALLHNPKTQHAFFWAPFILMGDWR